MNRLIFGEKTQKQKNARKKIEDNCAGETLKKKLLKILN